MERRRRGGILGFGLAAAALALSATGLATAASQGGQVVQASSAAATVAPAAGPLERRTFRPPRQYFRLNKEFVIVAQARDGRQGELSWRRHSRAAASRALAMKRRTFSGSFCPGLLSTPLATSTP